MHSPTHFVLKHFTIRFAFADLMLPGIIWKGRLCPTALGNLQKADACSVVLRGNGFVILAPVTRCLKLFSQTSNTNMLGYRFILQLQTLQHYKFVTGKCLGCLQFL